MTRHGHIPGLCPDDESPLTPLACVRRPAAAFTASSISTDDAEGTIPPVVRGCT
jgi:hypothetical protein